MRPDHRPSPTPRLLRSVCCFGLMALAAVCGAQQPPEQDEPASVDALIEQLGDPRYAERIDARRKLATIGLGAFDQLLVGASHRDPEVAHACVEVLDELTRRWARREDPAWLRRLLASYADLTIPERVDVIRSMGRSSHATVADALCRIARYDRSPLASRAAGVELIGRGVEGRTEEWIESVRAACSAYDARHGESQRLAMQWVGLWLDQDLSPEDRQRAWRDVAGAERRLYATNAESTNEPIFTALIAKWLVAAVGAGDAAATQEAALEYISLTENGAIDRITETVLLIGESGAQDTATVVLQGNRDALGEKRALYLSARLASARGDEDEAQRLARQASAQEAALEVTGAAIRLDPRIAIAKQLHEAGFADWSRREYRAILDATEDLTIDTAAARWLLADSLQDAERYLDAAELLAELSDAITKDDDSKRLYRSLAQRAASAAQDVQLPDGVAVSTRRWLYEALGQKALGDREAEIAALRESIGVENRPSDADVLIAMYRVEDPPEEFRALTLQSIRLLCEDLESTIDAEPSNPLLLNHWAWLVSNTEGDYAKAVRYSRRSLELMPGDAGQLDTLGRCLFAVGDLEGALEVQREAVAKKPMMLVLKRQLDEFEAALAARDAAEEQTP